MSKGTTLFTNVKDTIVTITAVFDIYDQSSQSKDGKNNGPGVFYDKQTIVGTGFIVKHTISHHFYIITASQLLKTRIFRQLSATDSTRGSAELVTASEVYITFHNFNNTGNKTIVYSNQFYMDGAGGIGVIIIPSNVTLLSTQKVLLFAPTNSATSSTSADCYVIGNVYENHCLSMASGMIRDNHYSDNRTTSYPIDMILTSIPTYNGTVGAPFLDANGAVLGMNIFNSKHPDVTKPGYEFTIEEAYIASMVNASSCSGGPTGQDIKQIAEWMVTNSSNHTKKIYFGLLTHPFTPNDIVNGTLPNPNPITAPDNFAYNMPAVVPISSLSGIVLNTIEPNSDLATATGNLPMVGDILTHISIDGGTTWKPLGLGKLPFSSYTWKTFALVTYTVRFKFVRPLSPPSLASIDPIHALISDPISFSTNYEDVLGVIGDIDFFDNVYPQEQRLL